MSNDAESAMIRASIGEVCSVDAEPVGALRAFAAGDVEVARQIWRQLASLGFLSVQDFVPGGVDEAWTHTGRTIVEALGSYLLPGPVTEHLAWLPVLNDHLTDRRAVHAISDALLGEKVVGLLKTMTRGDADTPVAGHLDSGLVSLDRGSVKGFELADEVVTITSTDGAFAVVGIPPEVIPHDRRGGMYEAARVWDTEPCEVEPGWVQTITSAQARTLISEAQIRSAIVRLLLLAGMARALVETTRSYVLTREQFGVAIGSFQAVKHRMARMHAEAIQLSATATTLSRNPAAGELALLSAERYCCDRTIWIAEAAIQLHGGMGFSAETAPHLFLKAAWLLKSDSMGDGQAEVLWREAVAGKQNTEE